ncbi:DUF4395 domain-containing protein [Paenibacillus thalictri]|uniref:DUF4395 domain-containing protein n=1 Tax=Paenibacillus thalictri TaxID=2527873 RepID=A0A4V2J3V3_9BACL|nr:DUF4395 domain-containing protein [Paenibacillus thalictri]TBL75744.1 DUF4395 domain-containing protein [Paenibacillus thalictri]
MNQPAHSIPRPLVRTNQAFIVLSVVLTWITGAYWILLLPLIAGLAGILFDYNPVIRLAKRFLTKHPSEYTPEDANQQKFNQLIAIFLLFLGYFSFFVGWTALAYIATIMVALAATIAILGFCIGCFIYYQWTQYRYRKSRKT